jgi:hypothetical protein
LFSIARADEPLPAAGNGVLLLVRRGTVIGAGRAGSEIVAAAT